MAKAGIVGLHLAGKRVQTRCATVGRKVDGALGDLPTAFVNGHGDPPGMGESGYQVGVAASIEVVIKTGDRLPEASPERLGWGSYPKM
ncbi:MAG TPA: hypothetical protein VGM25_10535 [Caulobacteraceae bacterium]|jgi:hypothetical protein